MRDPAITCLAACWVTCQILGIVSAPVRRRRAGGGRMGACAPPSGDEVTPTTSLAASAAVLLRHAPWDVAFWFMFRTEHHINVLEARALVRLVQWIGQRGWRQVRFLVGVGLGCGALSRVVTLLTTSPSCSSTTWWLGASVVKPILARTALAKDVFWQRQVRWAPSSR